MNVCGSAYENGCVVGHVCYSSRLSYYYDGTCTLYIGHCELAKRTGAVIYYGPGAASRTQFAIHELKDNEVSIILSRILSVVWTVLMTQFNVQDPGIDPY